MSIVMFDSIDVNQIPADAVAAAGYTGGMWPTFGELQRRFPHAHLLSIAIRAGDDGQCLDVETGDAVVSEIYGWFKRQQGRKVWRPVIYTSVSNMDNAVAAMYANGFKRADFRLWSAHYAGPHICGPGSCGQTRTNCDGTQWTSNSHGRSLDESLLSDDFFGGSTANDWTARMIANLPTLQLGSKDGPSSRYVARCQGLCGALGSPVAASETGTFGQSTLAAVKAQQAAFGLIQDGICGKATWTALVTGG